VRYSISFPLVTRSLTLVANYPELPRTSALSSLASTKNASFVNSPPVSSFSLGQIATNATLLAPSVLPNVRNEAVTDFLSVCNIARQVSAQYSFFVEQPP